MARTLRIPSKAAVVLGPDDLRSMAQQENALKWIRGNFLELVADVEEKADALIALCIAGVCRPEFTNVFISDILYSRSFSLAWKIRVLKRLAEEGKLLDAADERTLAKDLDFLASERNKFAHGKVFYEKIGSGLQSFLSYVNARGVKADMKLNGKYFDDLSARLISIHKNLDKIKSKLA